MRRGDPLHPFEPVRPERTVEASGAGDEEDGGEQKGAQSEEEESGEEEEEGRAVKMARSPGCPTEEMRKEHAPTHLPFRSWCRECVEGRLDNPPHRAVAKDERGVPEVSMDYAFLGKEGEPKTLTTIGVKDRDSRIIMADVMQTKGCVHDDSVETVVQNLKRLGHRGRILLKVDNESPIKALREAVIQRLGREASDEGGSITIIPEEPPKSESYGR